MFILNNAALHINSSQYTGKTMIKKILESLKAVLRSPSFHDGLDAYITAGNPQTPNDVDRLEREFFRRRESLFSEHYN